MNESAQLRLTDESVLHVKVREIASGIASLYAPKTLMLIAVDHWFGSRWLEFAGKMLGMAGVWSHHKPCIPPFVPARIVSQRRFVSPNYVETDAGSPLHIEVSSSFARRRKLAIIEPDTAFVWYSADSSVTGQMSLMAYIPFDRKYFNWYALLERHGDDWKAHELVNISDVELRSLQDSGFQNLVG